MEKILNLQKLIDKCKDENLKWYSMFKIANEYLNINDIENAYNNDEDWIRKTIEVSGGLGVGFFAGSLFSTATVPLIAAVGGGLIVALPLTVILIAAGIGFGIAVGVIVFCV